MKKIVIIGLLVVSVLAMAAYASDGWLWVENSDHIVASLSLKPSDNPYGINGTLILSYNKTTNNEFLYFINAENNMLVSVDGFYWFAIDSNGILWGSALSSEPSSNNWSQIGMMGPVLPFTFTPTPTPTPVPTPTPKPYVNNGWLWIENSDHMVASLLAIPYGINGILILSYNKTTNHEFFYFINENNNLVSVGGFYRFAIDSNGVLWGNSETLTGTDGESALGGTWSQIGMMGPGVCPSCPVGLPLLPSTFPAPTPTPTPTPTPAPTPTPSSYILTVQMFGSGNGRVTGTGINCGSVCPIILTSGTQVTLTATPDSGSTFTGWSGCDITNANACAVTMNQNRFVRAFFSPSSPTPTPTPTPSGYEGIYLPFNSNPTFNNLDGGQTMLYYVMLPSNCGGSGQLRFATNQQQTAPHAAIVVKKTNGNTSTPPPTLADYNRLLTLYGQTNASTKTQDGVYFTAFNFGSATGETIVIAPASAYTATPWYTPSWTQYDTYYVLLINTTQTVTAGWISAYCH